MHLHELGSTDPRFKTLEFKTGLNLLLADRSDVAADRLTRNGSGKSSAVALVRWLVGGGRPAFLDHVAPSSFHARFGAPGQRELRISRPASKSTKARVEGIVASGQVPGSELAGCLAPAFFALPVEAARPTPGQLWAQLARDYFGDPWRTSSWESDWESGVRLGFFLGITPEVTGRAGDLAELGKNLKAAKKAAQSGVLRGVSTDMAKTRADLGEAKALRDRTRAELDRFEVDEAYADHLRRADESSAELEVLNNGLVADERRRSQLETALRESHVPNPELEARLTMVYAEVGMVLPEHVTRRYEEVAAFHDSVLRNRQLFLEQELEQVRRSIGDAESRRAAADKERSELMQLLQARVALETFLEAERAFAEQDTRVRQLEDQLENARAISDVKDEIALRTAELKKAVDTEINDREPSLQQAVQLFQGLTRHVYADRHAQLRIESTDKGHLRVRPEMPGDDSAGITNVETVLLDLTCLVMGFEGRRTPPILIHDSAAFDGVDGRQVGRCLAAGARLAEQHSLQYIVTMNSDVLESAEKEAGLDFGRHVLPVRLSDAGESGGLFGFRF